MIYIKELVANLLLKLTPKRVLRVLAQLAIEKVSFNSHRFKISFSQKGEDVYLQNIFNKENGFYVDVGAYHPIEYSNTHVFYLKGWSGINIEPNPESIQSFFKLRARDINLNLAVSLCEDTLTYYKFNYSAVNTISKDHATYWASQPGHIIKEQTPVIVKPLKRIFEDFLPNDVEIDFMSVDCEGVDLDVLKSNDWNKFRPSIVLIEFLYYEYPDFRESELHQFMISVNYRFLGIVGISIFYSNNKDIK